MGKVCICRGVEKRRGRSKEFGSEGGENNLQGRWWSPMKGAGMIGKRKGRESGADTRLKRGRWWSPMRDVGMIVEKRGGQILDPGEGGGGVL